MDKKKKTRINFFKQFTGRRYALKSYRPLILKIIAEEGINLRRLNVIGVNDKFLRVLHSRYLDQDRYTDVMTFRLEENAGTEAEIYISIERAAVNARHYGVNLEEEIARLIVHGLLHLKGYDDGDEIARNRMHQKENQLLSLYWKKTEN